MTRKIYRTAQGKMVDLGRLQLQHENIRAVGNMGVNARGDLIDSSNRPIDSRNQQVAKQYRRQTSKTIDERTMPAAKPVKKKKINKSAAQVAPDVEIPVPPEDFQDDVTRDSIDQQRPTGLAAAIARARQIKQEPIKTQQELVQHTEGVRKI